MDYLVISIAVIAITIASFAVGQNNGAPRHKE